LLLAVLQISGLGGLFLGLAGALAALIKAIWGVSAIATPFPAGSYSQADCERWLAAYPFSPNCAAAATADHAADFLRNAALAGILGVVALIVRQLLRRRWPDQSGPIEPLVGAGLAGLSALGFAAVTFNAVTVTHSQGVGQPISLAVAAGGAAVLLAGAAHRAAGRSFWARRG
jgi:hypothetical protein